MIKLWQKYMRPEDAGGGGGGAVDRGDDFTPTPDESEAKPAPSAEDQAAAAALEAERAAKTAAEAKPKAEGDPETDADGKPKAKDTRVPLSRHKEILDAERARREAVETELAKYRQGAQVAEVNTEITAAENELAELEKSYAKLLEDGKVSEATAVMTKIRRTERTIIEKSSQMREAAAEARAVERARYDITVSRLEEQYPFLNVDSPDFDKDKTGEVLELKEAYQLKGYTPTAALQKAVRLLVPPETKAQEQVLDTEPRVNAAAVEAARKTAAKAATADAVAATPASAAKVGLDSPAAGGGAVTAKDILKMPYKDFAALDETTLARARGDVVA